MIGRRELIGTTAAGAFALGLPRMAFAATQAGATPPANPAEAAAMRLYDRLFEDLLRAVPPGATYLGLDKGPRAALKRRLPDAGYANRYQPYKIFADARPALAALNRDAMSDRGRVHLDSLRWYADVSARIAQPAYGGTGNGYPVPYVVSQLAGSYQDVPSLLTDRHEVANAADAEAYLARLAALPRVLDQETDRVRADAARGVIPPSYILAKTLAQLNAFAGQRGADALLVKTLADKTRAANVAGDWGTRAQRVVDGTIAAAAARQVAAIDALRSRAGYVPGVGRLPDGEAFYATCLRFHTTTPLTPEEAHRIGNEQLAALTAEADTLLRARGLTTGSVGARLSAARRDPALLYANSDAGRTQLLADLNARVAELRRMMARIFSDQPRSGMEVRRVPVATEIGAPGAYASSGALDGSTPGIFYINLRDMTGQSKMSLPTLIHHEAVPGHLWEGAIAAQYGDAPMLFQALGFTAYGEGWGLYAEQMGDELGVYADDPAGKLGYLQSFMFRATRIVVDTGMHALGWSRARAIETMVSATGNPPGEVEREIDRYIVWPGQATAYKIGHTEIVRIREAARTRLGARFDLKAFNDLVVRGGGMPLEVLARRVEAWNPA